MSEEDKMDAAILAAKGEKMASSATRKNARRAKAEAVPAMDDDSQAVKTANNNERVLKLFKEGKNSRDIAKELNLGVGEVQLVIDLYNSTK
jgi:DNA-binding NarL/FixJ family response regulator